MDQKLLTRPLILLAVTALLAACSGPEPTPTGTTEASPAADSGPPTAERTTPLSKEEIALLDKLTASQAFYQPTFNLKDRRTVAAGKAWCGTAVKPADTNQGFNPRATSTVKNAIIAPLHLLGPDGGLEKQLPASHIAGMIDHVELKSLANGQVVGSASEVLTKTGSAFNPKKGEACADDLILLAAPVNNKIQPLVIAFDAPKVGQQVWLCTRTATSTMQLYPATVKEVSDQALKVRLQYKADLKAQSGSPLVDAEGKAVGMLIAFNSETGEILCNPSTAISAKVMELVK